MIMKQESWFLFNCPFLLDHYKDVKERQAKMSTLDQPGTHLIDAALAHGGRIACIEAQLPQL